MDIQYLAGDATLPQGEGNKIIVHICNDIGGWGRGFVLALSRRWKAPEQLYREWYKSGEKFTLGEVQFVPVETDITVCNMIGQRDIKKQNGIPPIRYGAVRSCLEKVAARALDENASVHMPRIGCGLAGGEWGEIETIIEDTLLAKAVPVFVYDLR